MSQIILDLSANTHKNDLRIIKRAIREISKIDTGKHTVVFKTQLFKEAGDNIACTHQIFSDMYDACLKEGYGCTASVFDLDSLNFLLGFDIQFVKIANRPDLYWLVGEVPRKYDVYRSYGMYDLYTKEWTTNLACVSAYPASKAIYETIFTPSQLDQISDHTIGLELYKEYKPFIWEKHLKLSDSTGLDAGDFAITPQELAEIL